MRLHRIVPGVWLMLIVWVLSGCSGPGAAPASMQYVNAHGSNPDHAQRNAMQKATAACQGKQPIVLDKHLYPAPPTFDEMLFSSTTPSQISGLAASSHEGDSPAIRLSFHCADG